MSEKLSKEFITKVNKSELSKFDLSADEDLSLAIMNLVSIEEHLFFTAKKTNSDKYFDLLSEVRETRKSLLEKIIKDKEGEVWCISKHLMAASMRLIEVGNKQYTAGNKKEANGLYEKAYGLYNLFWGLNLKLIEPGKIEKIDEKALNRHDTKKSGFMGKLGDLVKKAIDCCIE